VRGGKVFIDWSQNDEHKTTVSVYSLRARERPTVSTPVTWEEVEEAWTKKKVEKLVFEAGQVLERCDDMGDLFAPLLTLEQKLPKVAADGLREFRLRQSQSLSNPLPRNRNHRHQGPRRRGSGDIASLVPITFRHVATLCRHFGLGVCGWKPDFYPAKLAQKKFLNHYAAQLNTVEVNFTFRQLVKESTLNNWIADTPESFRFGVKAHQILTHIKRLKATADFCPGLYLLWNRWREQGSSARCYFSCRRT